MRYTFKVVSEEMIDGPGGKIDCWKVTSDYNIPNYLSTFWFAKETQLMVRLEGRMPDGRTLVKTLID
jgi:hypothetical protein